MQEYTDKFKGAVYTKLDPNAEFNPLWNHKADCAFPSATQNEVNGKDAANLLKNGVYVISEGANMPSSIEAINQFVAAKFFTDPAKLLTPVVLLHPAWRWHRTACAIAGHAKKLTTDFN